jgi:hypothetical protein
MRIKEKVEIVDSKDSSALCNLMYSAIRGELTLELETSQGAEELEALTTKEFDKFATKYFNEGRKYEKDKK